MNRTIIDVVTSRHGNSVNIYAVENPEVRLSALKPYTMMQVSYRLGIRSTHTFTGKYLEATADYRSLIFEHPTKGEGRRIFVPTNNILSLSNI